MIGPVHASVAGGDWREQRQREWQGQAKGKVPRTERARPEGQKCRHVTALLEVCRGQIFPSSGKIWAWNTRSGLFVIPFPVAWLESLAGIHWILNRLYYGKYNPIKHLEKFGLDAPCWKTVAWRLQTQKPRLSGALCG